MPMLSYILFGLFAGATLLQLVYWIGVIYPLRRQRQPEQAGSRSHLPVSVVVCARNALASLQRALPIWLAQDYPDFELVIVDDGSVDGSVEWLRKAQASAERLRVIEMEEPTLPGKKEALTRGIDMARHPLVLLTDADCLPLSRFWIDRMQAPLRGSVEIGLGLGLYQRRPGWLNRFIRFEALTTGMQYLGLARAGMPYMGVGRNLIYTRDLFQRQGGFGNHQHLISGDDDLFVNHAATSFNTVVNAQAEALTLSEPKTSWRAFFRQKKRHLSVGRNYRAMHKFTLGALAGSWIGHYLLGLTLLIGGWFTPWVPLLYLLRQVSMMLVTARLWPKWRSGDLLPWLPLLDLAYPLYLLRMAPTALWGKIRNW